MPNLGEFLKAERERKGIRLSDISTVTKIQIHNLKLIEEGNWKALPAKPFVKGFITAYAKYVGLNGTEIYQRYLEETEPAPVSFEEPESPPPTQVVTNSRVLPIKPILISLSALTLLLGSVWLIRIGKQPSETPVSTVVASQPENPLAAPAVEAPREIASAPEIVAPAPTVVAAPSSPNPDPVPTNPKDGHQLEVTAKERTWVKIVIDEAPPVNLHLSPGEKTQFSAKEKIKLVLGNAPGSEVLYNGALNEGKKYSGTIRYYIFPAGSKFPQDKPREVAQEMNDLQESSNSAEMIPEAETETSQD